MKFWAAFARSGCRVADLSLTRHSTLDSYLRSMLDRWTIEDSFSDIDLTGSNIGDFFSPFHTFYEFTNLGLIPIYKYLTVSLFCFIKTSSDVSKI